jgi:hypothetical protein
LYIGSPLSRIANGECFAIINRTQCERRLDFIAVTLGRRQNNLPVIPILHAVNRSIPIYGARYSSISRASS